MPRSPPTVLDSIDFTPTLASTNAIGQGVGGVDIGAIPYVATTGSMTTTPPPDGTGTTPPPATTTTALPASIKLTLPTLTCTLDGTTYACVAQ
jgi:hypothetical protein